MTNKSAGNIDGMIIGVPKETKEQEFRVALLPSAVYQLVKRGHHLLVESQAGAEIGFHDADYLAAGAKVVESHEEVFSRAEMIVKSRSPSLGVSCFARDRSSSRIFIWLPIENSPSV